jgi:ABC-type histidine transport system ATPase subunit
MEATVPALYVEDMHKSFGALEVLKGVSLAAHDGDVILIIGSSGSGKKTLLRCINPLENPDRGSVAGEAVDLKLGPGAVRCASLPRITLRFRSTRR